MTPESSLRVPDIAIGEVLAKPQWLACFEEEMRYFRPDAIIDAKPDITREKLALFDTTAPQLAEALCDMRWQPAILDTLGGLQDSYSERYTGRTDDLDAADAVYERVTRFALLHTPILAHIAFDETNGQHRAALGLAVHAGSSYGAGPLVAAHIHLHTGLYDRYRRLHSRAPQLYAQHLLQFAAPPQQAIVAATLDGLRQEGHNLSADAASVGREVGSMHYPVHPDVTRFVLAALGVSGSQHELAQSYFTALQYSRVTGQGDLMKPFEQFVAELMQGDKSIASQFRRSPV